LRCRIHGAPSSLARAAHSRGLAFLKTTSRWTVGRWYSVSSPHWDSEQRAHVSRLNPGRKSSCCQGKNQKTLDRNENSQPALPVHSIVPIGYTCHVLDRQDGRYHPTGLLLRGHRRCAQTLGLPQYSTFAGEASHDAAVPSVLSFLFLSCRCRPFWGRCAPKEPPPEKDHWGSSGRPRWKHDGRTLLPDRTISMH
jgi:hypothetical protein